MIDALFGLCVRTNDGAALKSVEHLCGVKTKNREIAMIENTAISILYAESVGGIVDHAQIIGIRNLLDRSGVARLAIAVHRQDACGLRGYGFLDASRVQIQCLRVDVHKDGPYAVP